jgi:hypothetical protein
VTVVVLVLEEPNPDGVAEWRIEERFQVVNRDCDATVEQQRVVCAGTWQAVPGWWRYREIPIAGVPTVSARSA